jgi:Uma2 family endonuclease
MTITIRTQLTFSEFLEHLPDQEGRYELVNGEILRIQATRGHSDVIDFISDLLRDQVRNRNLPYLIKHDVLIRTMTKQGQEQGRNPDLSVVDKSMWKANPSAYSALVEPIPLAIEVISTNWRDDYIDKFDEYLRLGILEYWIVDYMALGGGAYLGKPKVPTVFVHLLDGDRYTSTAYRSGEQIVSRTFPELRLTVDQILSCVFSES